MKSQRTRVAAYGLILRDDAVLLCRLSKLVPKWEGYWTLPGGGLDFGEAPEVAVVREVAEETGLQVKVTRFAHVDNSTFSTEREDIHSVRLVYFAEVIGGELRPEASGTTDFCAWHSLKALGGLNVVDLVSGAVGAIHQSRLPTPD